MRSRIVTALLAVSAAALADEQSGASSTPTTTTTTTTTATRTSTTTTSTASPASQQEEEERLRKELEEAIRKDTKAAQQAGTPAATPAPEAATGGGQTPPTTPFGRGAQSLNPDVSVILDGAGGYQRRPQLFQNGDDPTIRNAAGKKALGFTAQELELAFSAIVDPYFKGEAYVTVPNLAGFEIEEVFATTTSLPWNLQVKAGSFRSAFGRQNGQHLHVQDFTRRPFINSAFLGVDGLRGPGAQVSWLAPLLFYLTLYAEAFSARPPDSASPDDPRPPAVQSFGGGETHDLTYLAHAKAFFPFGDEWSLLAGTSFATGVSPGAPSTGPSGPTFVGAGRRSILVGGDLYLKWKPLNVARGYTSFAWQSEVVFRHLDSAEGGFPSEWDGGLYSQIVVQLARRWFVGMRGDVVGLPSSSVLGRALRGSASVTLQLSEFARVRGYAELEKSVSVPQLVSGPLYAALVPDVAPAAWLQLEISIGAHGAHPY